MNERPGALAGGQCGPTNRARDPDPDCDVGFPVSFAAAVQSVTVPSSGSPPASTSSDGGGATVARPIGGTRSLPFVLVAWVRRHPDLTCLLLLLVVGAAARLAFAFRAPPLFVGGDSQTYLVPGYELAHGFGFAPILKRPPLYPLFVAFSIVLMGEDPTAWCSSSTCWDLEPSS